MPAMTTARSALAVAHVRALAEGAPMPRALRVTLNFHPDRRVDGRTVLEGIARDGVYRSQFETGTSNGGLTAHPGGDRWRWESRLFGGVYDDAPAGERPRYGALNHRRRAVGAAPRFGSAHLRLAAHTLDRATFCFPDSVFDPTHFATADRMGLTALADAFDARPRSDEVEATEGGVLDDYIEAHVHGTLSLRDDVEAIVLDPSYRGTEIDAQAHALGVPVEWHEGFVATSDALGAHPEFRGPHVAALAVELAGDGLLTSRVLGEAWARETHDPQALKRVWHMLARFGRDWGR